MSFLPKIDSYLNSEALQGYTKKHFILFRIILGLYLTQNFLQWIPFSDDLNWIKYSATPMTALHPYTFYFMAFFSFMFALGIYRKVFAVLLLIGFYGLLMKMQLIFYGINVDFLSMLVFTTLFIPDENKKNINWIMPNYVYYSVYSVFVFGLFLSGVNKVLESEDWRSGWAIYEFFAVSPIYKSELLSQFIKNNPLFFNIFNYAVLILEVGYIFLIANKYTKFITRLSTVVFFISLVFLTRMSEVASANLICLIFLFQKKWLKII